MGTANIKQALHHLADVLPETATWKDLAYEAYVRQEMETGLANYQFTSQSAGELHAGLPLVALETTFSEYSCIWCSQA